jgi:signal transduction histidine kinase
MQNSPLTRKSHTVFALLGLLTVLLGGTTVFAMVRARADVNEVERSHRILTAIQALKASVTQTESSVRGFMVTGDNTFLDQFAQRRPQAETDAINLRALLAGDAEQRHRVDELLEEVRVRISYHLETIEERKAGESPVSIGIRHKNEGRRLSNEIDQLASELGAEEERKLAERTTQRRQTQIAMLSLCGVGLLASITLVWVGQRTIVTYRDLRDRSEEGLEKLNANLEQRVAERTASLQKVNAQLEESKTDLTQLVDALRRSNIELEKFAYAAGHDLQEPIRNVRIFAELLDTRYGPSLPQDGHDYVKTIIDASSRLGAVVSALLEYARLNLDSNDRLESVNLADLVAIVEENLLPQIQSSGARITYRNLPALNGSRLELLHLIQHLIGNSLKYRSPDRPCRIDISAERDGLYWKVSVVDNGIGFSSEYKDYIFGVLRRLDRNNSGAGFGLAICKNIVERHGGRIWAESEAGQGATFSFLWPV